MIDGRDREGGNRDGAVSDRRDREGGNSDGDSDGGVSDGRDRRRREQ